MPKSVLQSIALVVENTQVSALADGDGDALLASYSPQLNLAEYRGLTLKVYL